MHQLLQTLKHADYEIFSIKIILNKDNFEQSILLDHYS